MEKKVVGGRNARHRLLLLVLVLWIAANSSWLILFGLSPTQRSSGASSTRTSLGKAATIDTQPLLSATTIHRVDDDDEETMSEASDEMRKAPTRKPWKDDQLPPSIGMSKHAARTSPQIYHASKRTISFMIIGDWGGPGREPQREVAAAMDIVATRDFGHSSANPLDFVVSTGDNIYEDGASSIHDVRFKRNFEKVYTQPTLQTRWYMSLGNHDHGAHGVIRNVSVQVEYSKHSNKWFLPSTYYSQLFEIVAGPGEGFTVELFVLDTYDVSPRLTRISSSQLAWLSEALQNSTADWKLVVGHRPLFSAGRKHGSSPYMQHKLLPLLKKFHVAAYLSGDDHDLQVLKYDGIWFAVSGGGARAKQDLRRSGTPQTVFQAGVHGFMHLLIHNASTATLSVYNKRAEKLYGGQWNQS